jgi:hypothetical protein
MQAATVVFDLGEALVHLQELVAEFDAGKLQADDEPTLAVQLGHILDHICRAWNCKDMSPEQKVQLSQEEFERLSSIVPNFSGRRFLGEIA